MHRSEIRPDVMQRIVKRRGRAPIREHLAARSTALIVIDMQRAFVDESLPSTVAVAREIVPNINRLAAEFRRHGAPVVWVYTTFTDAIVRDWSAFFGGIYSSQFSDAVIGQLTAGSFGHGLYDGLAVHQSDRLVSKDRFSAFLPSACNLGEQLRELGVDTVVIGGTLTNVCCESSARDAMMHNFNVVMAADANAAQCDADHNASLTALAQTFADVMDVDQIIAAL